MKAHPACKKNQFKLVLLTAILSFTILATTACILGRRSSPSSPRALAPIDPQKVEDQDVMTWDDYRPIPGVNYANSTDAPSSRTIHIALVVADFEDQPFVMTLPKRSDLFGNPQIDPIPRADMAKFYADFWNKPQAINHYHSVNEYWMELSHGQIGVQFDAYGPYKMPRKMIEYPEATQGGVGGGGGRRGGGGRGAQAGDGATTAGQAAQSGRGVAANTARGTGARGGRAGRAGGAAGARSGDQATSGSATRGGRGGRGAGGRAGLAGDLDAQWRPQSDSKRYDLVLRIYAGYDETAIWQEFGEMKFQTRDDITPQWGNPDPTQPRWSRTRYVDWTSWKAASYLWSNSAIITSESSGAIRHEISHAAFAIGDNNNNPYVAPYRRVGSGPWDLMDRGSFNGPGGPHKRYIVPEDQGGAMPAGVMLRQALNFGFITKQDTLQLNRDGLAKSGLAVAKVMAREVKHGPDSLAGLTVTLNGAGDKTPEVDPDKNPLYSGPGYDYYSLEVVQRIGCDSFCPDSGVLIAKNAETPGPVGGTNSYTCFNWVIDAHPEDINMVDFKRPNGENAMRTIADYRQLNDALFHAGLNSGSQYEWEDTPNRLHFYVIDVQKDAQGVLSYTLGVRSLEGSGPQQRGAALAAPGAQRVSQPNAECVFKLKNTGVAAATDPKLHRMDANKYLNSDIYRLAVSVEGQGWSAQVLNGLAAVKFGESQAVPVFVTRSAGSSPTAKVTLQATSESDPSKTITATCAVK